MGDQLLNISNFKIITLNVNSIISLKKRAELSIFLKENNPHVLLLCETKIKSIHKLKFNSYDIIRNDRTINCGGGTANLIKYFINYELLDVDTSK